MELKKMILFAICVSLLVSGAQCWLKIADRASNNGAAVEDELAEEVEIEVVEDSWAVNIVSDFGLNSNNAKDASKKFVDDSTSKSTDAAYGSSKYASHVASNLVDRTLGDANSEMNTVSDGIWAVKNKANDAFESIINHEGQPTGGAKDAYKSASDKITQSMKEKVEDKANDVKHTMWNEASYAKDAKEKMTQATRENFEDMKSKANEAYLAAKEKAAGFTGDHMRSETAEL